MPGPVRHMSVRTAHNVAATTDRHGRSPQIARDSTRASQPAAEVDAGLSSPAGAAQLSRLSRPFSRSHCADDQRRPHARFVRQRFDVLRVGCPDDCARRRGHYHHGRVAADAAEVAAESATDSATKETAEETTTQAKSAFSLRNAGIGAGFGALGGALSGMSAGEGWKQIALDTATGAAFGAVGGAPNGAGASVFAGAVAGAGNSVGQQLIGDGGHFSGISASAVGINAVLGAGTNGFGAYAGASEDRLGENWAPVVSAVFGVGEARAYTIADALGENVLICWING
jgi:hypothetical protein